MIYTTSLIPLFHLSKLFNLPSDITYMIYSNIINTSAQLIIDKWYSYVLIHNINICYIANNIPLLRGTIFNNEVISYYNLHDEHFYITLKICAKYLKPNISSKEWWSNFVYYGLNGYYFVDNRDDVLVMSNVKNLYYILGCLNRK